MWALHAEFLVSRAGEFCAAAQFVLCTARRPFNSLSGGELDRALVALLHTNCRGASAPDFCKGLPQDRVQPLWRC